jgi:hypothetical protein
MKSLVLKLHINKPKSNCYLTFQKFRKGNSQIFQQANFNWQDYKVPSALLFTKQKKVPEIT